MTSHKPVLVVLAAGMGSRYGGLKQMDKLGQSGEALLDYSVYDAKRSGFGKVVFIIRHDIEKDFKDIVLKRFGSALPYELVYQELDSLLPADFNEKAKAAGRTKPWGTAHALLCAEAAIDAPFAVLNADDFYSFAAIKALGEYLASPAARVEAAIVPYRLDNTLSPQGTVTRGVCMVKDGKLSHVEELKTIAREADGKIYNSDPDAEGKPCHRYLPDDTPVSMNCWGYPLGVFPHFRRYFEDFQNNWKGEPKLECYIPTATDWMIKQGYLQVKVLDAKPEWFGVTYQADREPTVKRIQELVKEGVYPASLWSRE
jgi:dTDP-glucose pyrophosphorylase